MMNNNTPAERFRAQTIRDPETGCLLWTGTGDEYGRIRLGRRGRVRVHRWVWELAHGPIPEGLCVLHHCDTPRCVEVTHLFLGTRADNNADKIAKGRAARQVGELNANARLSEADAMFILEDDRKPAEIAADYGVTTRLITYIKTGQRWSHLFPQEFSS